MTRAEFHDLRDRFPYYRARGPYLAAVAREVDDLIRRHDLRSALELGPHVRPAVTGADVMDLRQTPNLDGAGSVIVHNATVTPWPIADRQYDVFVALQVFEHLRGAQREAFGEACRVARHAIVSLPIDWVMSNPNDCHHQISQERAFSWFSPRLPTRIIEGNPGPKSRIIYVFENLDQLPDGSQAPRDADRP